MYDIKSCRICLKTQSEKDLKSTSALDANGVAIHKQLAYCVNEVVSINSSRLFN